MADEYVEYINKAALLQMDKRVNELEALQKDLSIKKKLKREQRASKLFELFWEEKKVKERLVPQQEKEAQGVEASAEQVKLVTDLAQNEVLFQRMMQRIQKQQSQVQQTSVQQVVVKDVDYNTIVEKIQKIQEDQEHEQLLRKKLSEQFEENQHQLAEIEKGPRQSFVFKKYQVRGMEKLAGNSRKQIQKLSKTIAALQVATTEEYQALRNEILELLEMEVHRVVDDMTSQIRTEAKNQAKKIQDVSTQLRTYIVEKCNGEVELIRLNYDTKLTKLQQELTEKYQNDKEELHEMALKKIDGISADLKQMDQQMKYEYQDFFNQRKKMKVMQQMDAQFIKTRLSEIEDTNKNLRMELQGNADLLKVILDTQEIDALIQKQELVDRENIGVFGLQKNKDIIDKNNQLYYNKGGETEMKNLWQILAGGGDGKIKSNLYIDRNCMNCSGNSAYLLKQLKIACLGYYNTPVMYKNKTYNFQELNEVKQKCIEDCKRILRERFHSVGVDVKQRDVHSELLKIQQTPSKDGPQVEDYESFGTPSTNLNPNKGSFFYSSSGFKRNRLRQIEKMSQTILESKDEHQFTSFSQSYQELNMKSQDSLKPTDLKAKLDSSCDNDYDSKTQSNAFNAIDKKQIKIQEQTRLNTAGKFGRPRISIHMTQLQEQDQIFQNLNQQSRAKSRMQGPYFKQKTMPAIESELGQKSNSQLRKHKVNLSGSKQKK